MCRCCAKRSAQPSDTSRHSTGDRPSVEDPADHVCEVLVLATFDLEEVQDPRLTTWEPRRLGDWLRAAADGRVPVTETPTEASEELLALTEADLTWAVAPPAGSVRRDGRSSAPSAWSGA